MTTGPLVLAILDGLALNPDKKANAFLLAKTPTLDNLFKTYSWTSLTSHGEAVGLPAGQMGNSEVGHLNIGAGRRVLQDLTKINESFEHIENFKNEDLSNFFKKLSTSNKSLHLIGLTSSGGVHSNLEHVYSLVTLAQLAGVSKVIIHVISDGRDKPQREAINELKALQTFVEKSNAISTTKKVIIGSLIGRFYGMDRDTRWERTELAYDLYTNINSEADHATDLISALTSAYAKDQTDEFVTPYRLGSKEDNKDSIIADDDGILFYNFRADRMKQIVSSFFDASFTGFKRNIYPKLSFVCTLTEYDENYPIKSLFPPKDITNHLGEVISKHGLKQLRIAETEKYPHVTYFFSGGEEKILEGEERILVPSTREVKTYDLKPEMSALEITSKLISRLEADDRPDVVILNFANCDMVGHTGNLQAAILAVETVDACVQKIYSTISKLNGTLLVTADHGNSDQMIDYDTNAPHTYHTKYKVPFIICDERYKSGNVAMRADGALRDIAPSILDILGITKPEEMDGSSLIIGNIKG